MATAECPMRIALNAHLLSFGPTHRAAGISWYIRNLISALRQIDTQNDYYAFFGDHRLPPEFRNAARFQPVISRWPTVRPMVRLLWEQLAQPLLLRSLKVDLLHSMGYVQPYFCPCRSVVTVHDLSFMLFPEYFNRLNRLYLTHFTRFSVRRADRVLAVSDSTRKDVIRLLGVSPDRVVTVHSGIQPGFEPLQNKAQVEAFRKSRQVDFPFILFVSTLEPRKNAERLVEAFALLRKQTNLPHKLVLGGAKGWLYSSIFKTIERLELQDAVILPGFVPAADLPLWYNCADLFVYPSLYEGFGSPPLEAMACGTPVVASNSSSLPEVVGDAGLLVAPTDVEGLARAMVRILTDPSLKAELIGRGIRQAAAFSWGTTADQTATLYATAALPQAGR
jgi:glycosyltransferase involved in cell wall biosynthesis